MESLFSRYRNIVVLLLVLCGQIILLAWQVKSDADVPMVRVWAVTAVTPVASAIENFREGTTGFFSNYFELKNAREQSRQLRTEVDRLRVENQLLKNELSSAQRAESLAGFQTRSPSKMIGARIIGATPGVGTKSVLIDRGSASGVRRDMAVVTPDGIVGKVVAVFPFASQVLSVTDSGFAAGVESQRNHVHGVLKGLGNGTTSVDYVPTGQKVEVGEMFFTSGEDRVFPEGLPVGKVTGVQEGGNFQKITVQPAGTESAPEEVLVILDPVHQAVPEEAPPDTPVFLAPDVNPQDQSKYTGGAAQTTADKLMDQYKKIGDAQHHVFGVGEPGTLPPNFNLKVPGVNAPAASGASGSTGPQVAKATQSGAAGAPPATGAQAPRPPSAPSATGLPTLQTPKPPGPRPDAGPASPTGVQTPKPLTPRPIAPPRPDTGSDSATGVQISRPSAPKPPAAPPPQP